MKKIITLLVLALLISPMSPIQSAQSTATRLEGRILLQVQSHGEAWYVSQGSRYYMKDGTAAYEMMRKMGLGITNADLAKIPTVDSTTAMNQSASVCSTNSLASRVKGQILLQVQSHGEAWYVDPVKCRAIYLKDGSAAYQIMRYLGLGITDSDLGTIQIGDITTYKKNTTTGDTTSNNTANTPPAEAISACTGKTEGATCTFLDKGTTATGVCDTKPGILACAPNRSSESNPNTTSGNTASTPLPAAAQSCINKTKDNPQCKDCCDCLSGVDSATRTSCRNTCATHDFTANSSFIPVSAPSTLGKNGDYSSALSKTTVDACKAYCENSMSLQCGDYQYCRLACDNKWGVQPGPGGQSTGTQPNATSTQSTSNQYSLTQAMSDNAQLSTISFSGLAFITGSAGADTFFPPGKVADFFGFQYMRDVDVAGYGHNTTFLSRVANNVLYILNDSQKAKLIALAKEQAPIYASYAYNRYPLMNAFRRTLESTMPSSATGLSTSVVATYTGNLYTSDADLSYNRAVVVGEIINSFTDTQKAYLAKMKFNDYSTWPDVSEDQTIKRDLTNDQFVAVMTYASELFSWYKGSLDADVYFCPERHGTYFGAFYMKDYPAMNNANYFIPTTVTGESGLEFLNILDTTQRSQITSIIDAQRSMLTEIAQIRTTVSTELRKAMTGGTPDKAKVYSLIERYGELDGQMSALYATRFAAVNKTLTSAQRAALVKLRNLDVVPSGGYKFSTPVAMPTISNTDYMFGIGSLPLNAGQTTPPATFLNTVDPNKPGNNTE